MILISILISKKLKFSKQVPKRRYWITHNRTRTKHNSDFSEIKQKRKIPKIRIDWKTWLRLCSAALRSSGLGLRAAWRITARLGRSISESKERKSTIEIDLNINPFVLWISFFLSLGFRIRGRERERENACSCVCVFFSYAGRDSKLKQWWLYLKLLGFTVAFKVF